jgi:uncharacterized RDD family membrane protein YckC
MKCPNCNNAETDQSGSCPGCGFQVQAGTAAPDAPEPEKSANPAEPEPEEGPDVPQWRLELSRRLKEIKEKREGGSAQLLREDRMRPLPFPKADPEPATRTTVPGTAPEGEGKRPPRGTAAGARPIKRAARSAVRPESVDIIRGPVSPQKSAAPEIPAAPATPQQSVDIVFRGPASAQKPAPDVRNVIDDLITKQNRPAAVEVRLAPVPVVATAEEVEPDGKLVLLSRTLSGLVDLLFVFLWTVAFIVAEDMFSGIEIFDFTSIRNAALLLVANYFLYSLFFLGTANQTIGMMITNLHVVGESGRRPGMGRVALRCLLFLPSLLLLGAGLVWGFIDRQSRCLHDTFSQTRVEPLAIP